jgi:hypothetical protein
MDRIVKVVGTEVRNRQDGAARRRIITGSRAQLGHRITGH